MTNENGRFRFWDFEKRCHYFTNQAEQMSATDISNAKICEYKVYYKMLGTFKPPKSVYLVIGSIFHNVIEQDMRYKAKRGVNQKWVDLQEYFESAWKQGIKDLKDFGKFTEQQAKNVCLNYVKIYSIKMSPMLYPLNNESIEKFFCLPITFQEKRLKITGKVDLIGRDLFVTDHKSASSPWSQVKADEEIQAQIYPFCLMRLDYPVKGFRFNVVCGNNVTPYQVEYDQKKVKKILTDAFVVKDRIENNAMLRSRSEKTCKWCEYGIAGVCKESLCQNANTNGN